MHFYLQYKDVEVGCQPVDTTGKISTFSFSGHSAAKILGISEFINSNRIDTNFINSVTG